MIDDPLANFLQSLANDGLASVTSQSLPKGTRVSEAVVALLARLDGLARAESGLECPAYLPDAAEWAARVLYHLCQFTVCRDIGEERIRELCSEPCPGPRGPATDWSVDLLLQHLPGVYRAAAHLNPADPMLVELRRIASDWPLSSVGIPNPGKISIGSFIGHPALARIYADRIAETQDASRLGDPGVEALIRADIGLHSELAPQLARRLANG